MGKRKKRIFLRADGNSQMGMGHVIRSLALAEMLSPAFECHFIIRDPDTGLSNIILNICDGLIKLENNIKASNEADFLNSKYINCDDILVLDGYHFNTPYQSVFRKAGIPLACIDDIHAYPFIADLIINHAGGVDQTQYTHSFYTKCCLGTDYLLLRPPFLDAVKADRKLSPVKTAFVCMGGADPVNFTLEVIEQHLPKIEGLEEAIIVLGSSYPFRDSLDKVIEKSAVMIRILQNIGAQEMVMAMQASQIGICSASSICYEYLCIGGGLFVVQTVDNQKDLYNFLIKNQLALPLEKINDIPDLKPFLKRQRAAADGRSPDRFLRIFKQLGRKVEMKTATADEMLLYHKWANDPATRSQSFNSEPIPLDDHKNWFNRKLNDPDTVLLTAYCDAEPVGQIRFDISGKEALISYSVAKEHRGKGLGFDLIKQGILVLREKRPEASIISGYVKQQNIASSITFKRLNFAESHPDDTGKHPDSFKYTLNLSNEIF